MPTHIVAVIDGYLCLIQKGRSGWRPLRDADINGIKTLADADAWVRQEFGVNQTPTAEQREQAVHCAIFGWDNPAEAC